MLEKESFGKLKNNQEVFLYHLKNQNGIEIEILNYGGIVRSINTPDKNGHLADIVLGYDDIASYEKDEFYMGALIGRYANRIAYGRFSLYGKEYNVPKNNGENHIHGGTKAFHNQIWNVRTIESNANPGLILSINSPDGDQGFPGSLICIVRITLTHENELSFEYEAECTQPTVINLTHHGYFNLTGSQDKSILDHIVRINAEEYTPIDKYQIPDGSIIPVLDTPFYFSEGKTIGRDMFLDHPQLKYGNGFDHNWVLQESAGEVRFAASAHDPDSGRYLEMHTDQPGMQFYTGNFLNDKLPGKEGRKHLKHSAFCFEAQHFPDSPNKPEFPSTFLEPGQIYRQKTIYRFSTR